MHREQRCLQQLPQLAAHADLLLEPARGIKSVIAMR